MADILTQKAIDLLIDEKFKQGAPAKAGAEVSTYSFTKRSVIDRERTETLENVQSAFAKTLQQILSIQLRTTFQVKVLGIEEVRYSDFALSLEAPCVAVGFRVGRGFTASGALDWGVDAGFYVLDRLLGGKGATLETKRGLTVLEQRVLRGMTQRALAALRDAWVSLTPISTDITKFESNPANLKVADPEARMLTTLVELTAEGLRSTMSVALPGAAVDAAFQDEHDAPAAKGKTKPAAAGRHDLLTDSTLRHASLTLTARLPRMVLTAREVSALAPGQVIHTAHLADAPVDVHVNGKLLYRGSLGKVNRHVGLKISDRATAPAPESLVHTRKGRVL